MKRTAPPCGTASMMLSASSSRRACRVRGGWPRGGRGDEAQVAARASRMSAGCALRQQLALVQHEHLRTALGFVQIGSGDDHRQVLIVDQLQDDLPQFARATSGSTPTVGSSSSSRSGERTSVQARPSFCFMPPDSFPAGRAVKRAKIGHVQQPRVAFRCGPPASRHADRHTGRDSPARSGLHKGRSAAACS